MPAAGPLARPDFVLFDLDPAGVGFAEVVRAALLVREALSALGLESHPLTSGGDGIHIRVPIARRHTHFQTREFATTVGRALVFASGVLVTLERRLGPPAQRLLDTKMNGHGQQLVAPYSVRPLPGAPVATPLRWDELDEQLDPRDLTPAAVRERVRRDGDVYAAVLNGRQRLDEALAAF